MLRQVRDEIVIEDAARFFLTIERAPVVGVRLIMAITNHLHRYCDCPWLDVIDANSLYLIYWIEIEEEHE